MRAELNADRVRALADVHAMTRRGLVEPAELRRLFTTIEPGLLRYPAVDADVFRSKLEELLAEVEGD
jgi:hypothetical protein